MLLQGIVREFDEELMRLASLRAIIADLAHPRIDLDNEITHALLHPPLAAEDLDESSGELEADAETEDDSGPGKRRYTRRTVGGPVVRRARRRRPVEAGAIASTAPAGPVVVSAAALKNERTHRQQAPEANVASAQAGISAASPGSSTPAPLSTEGSNDLARVLAQRWLSGDAASA